MDRDIEHELCPNCKKDIPQHNYVMHTMHCARNITLCKTCNEPIPKAQFEAHTTSCVKPKIVPKKPTPPPTNLEKSNYFQERKAVEEKKQETRREKYLERHNRLVDTGYSLKGSEIRQNSVEKTVPTKKPEPTKTDTNGALPRLVNPPTKSSGLLACKYCDLEVPKLELEEHENYCGTRTDKCLECGEFIMFKNKQVHLDTNHGFLKLKDEPGPRASWDSQTQRSASQSTESSYTPRRRPVNLLENFDYDPMPYLPQYMPQSYVAHPRGGPPSIKIEKGESYKEISRRLDCKTEYIRNLLHDSASITVPLRHSGAVPRNHFNHNKGPAPQPPRRKNPPTELTIPCEFCDTPIPHDDLIQHETGCRPDLARFNPRRRVVEDDDYFAAPPQPSRSPNRSPYQSEPTQYNDYSNFSEPRYSFNAEPIYNSGQRLTSEPKYPSEQKYTSEPKNTAEPKYTSESSYKPQYSTQSSFSTQKQYKKQISQEYAAAPPGSPEVELPCEFCADMIPASQLLRHQATCA